MLRWAIGCLVAATVLMSGLAAPEAAATGCTSRTVEAPGGLVKLEVSCPEKTNKQQLSTKKHQCFAGPYKVPCHSDQGNWYSPLKCYISPAVGHIPFSDPAWQGHRTGALYDCRVSGLDTGSPYIIWLPTRTAPPDPELLARRAVSQMQLRPIAIGIVPEDRPDRVGLVGMPVWLWVADPAAQTWGPISRSASARGYTVRATAKVSQIRWLLGNGTAVSCTSRGTEYQPRFRDAMSPTCGYRYERQGRYTVTAVSHWLVRWSGIGQSGSFAIELRSQTHIQIGEAQVVTVSGGG